MLNKAQMTKMVDDFKGYGKRVEAAEAKVKSLEQEKASLIASKGFGGTTGANTNSDEQRALRFFGKSHPRDLMEVNVGEKKFSRVPDELKYLVLNFKKTVDVSRMISQMFNGDPVDFIGASEKKDRIGNCKGILNTHFGKEVLAPMIKAFGTGVSGGGQEWVPTAISSTYLEEFELRRVLESRFGSINMPTNPFKMPKISGVTKARKATEGQTGFTAGQFGTDDIEFSATKLEEFYVLPEELSEDSAPDFMAAGRDEVVRAQERAVESAILNGDNDGTHIDSDTQGFGADVAEKIWNGLRKLALANSANGVTTSFGAATLTEALLRTLRASLGKFGSDVENLIWIAGPSVYTQFLALPSVVTIDKMGPMATVLKGALAAYQGIPILNSEWMREDLNATGVYDGITTNKAGLVLVRADRFMIGNRRPIKVKLMEDLPGNDRWLLASYRRVDFKGHTQSATEKSVGYGYNIAL